MLTMAEKEDIREKYFNKGQSISEIAQHSGKDRKTVRKYVNQENWNAQPSVPRKGRVSKLDPYKGTILQWIEDDRKMRKKQRHTAKRVYDRLVELYDGDGFDCSYRTVADYVSEVKKQVYGEQRCFLPLEHHPGEAQVDFGKAEFLENGTRIFGSYLNLSFPHSNGGFFQLFKGENIECLEEGLKAIYEYIGGVPCRQWFDNASTMVTKIMKNGERKLTNSFLRFKEHYGFEAVFCNPSHGHEKGNVEAKVGYHRRNFLVPIPEFEDIDEYNRELLKKCSTDMDRTHYAKEKTILELYEEDRRACKPLPAVEFDVCSYEQVKSDAYGKFSLNNGRHIYSAVPQLASQSLTVAVRAHTVTVLDENLREVVRHKRLYGPKRQESMDWIPYLRQLSRYPAALKYSGIYTMLPDPVRHWMDRCERQERKKALQLLAELTEKTHFTAATEAFRQSVLYEAFDSDSVLAVYTRLTSSTTPLEKIVLPPTIPDVRISSPDVRRYDSILLEGRN